ncbi:hypothetical protein HAX54_052256 [Datura stramonium]|uniref:Clathrin/coatomer adaptor adaptin-like N-terminal domain-containing protein n=1 Tax=Datura stramonium TaxID=4076 RepID=A0ABS8T0I2_DATST|nr:hypothetical protein [Datura stramonium]
MALSGMRGLSVFISDIRNCQNKNRSIFVLIKSLAMFVLASRTKRLHPPYLAKDIRMYKAQHGLTPYEKKKYVWKMLYIYMLGYDVDFGHMEAVSLISAPKYPRSSVRRRSACSSFPMPAYVLCKYLKQGLKGRNETFQCLALTLVGNIGGREFAESLAPDVQKLLLEFSSYSSVEELARNQDIPQEYTYYGIPSPWLQVKTMRALQYFPTVKIQSTRRSLFGRIKRHQAQIITSLKDPDISIRRRALDLLYGMCDVSNAKDIVEELLQYLSTAEFVMREELSLKIAILAEKFAPDLSCDDIWFRVVQFVTNNEDLQPYAALKAREYLDKPAIHETMVKVSAYIMENTAIFLPEGQDVVRKKSSASSMRSFLLFRLQQFLFFFRHMQRS